MSRHPGRRPRQRTSRGASYVGSRHTVTVGAVAHGGHCVARLPLPDGASRVIFVRHALPGEQVVVEITEGTEGDRFWRGDAISILSGSPDRVSPPCPYAGPGLCGGCDFQHVALPAQRRLKADVVREQLVRLGGVAATDPLVADLRVEAVPGDAEGLRWRTRQRYVSTSTGRGMRRYRSHEVIPVEECLLAREDARETIDGARGPVPATVVEHVSAAGAEHDFEVAADGFWQVHPGAPRALVEEVLRVLDPQPGESVLDLYAGVGLFSAFLADRVGPTGHVLAVEGDRLASAHAARNVPSAEVVPGDAASVLAAREEDSFHAVVLDPPREGARRPVVEAVVARAPQKVAYVACDPAALARDVAIFAEHGYTLRSLAAYDLFPMTHHVECVVLLEKIVR
ncbi:MAG: class I SAM-dependent RNA methyltransferase [Nocardioides sp.]|nr:class I SAM-dependent RNA methyltransferase [Nocardioides sp.]